MHKELIIELRGVEFINKGAELMLHAIATKIRERFPNSILVMENRLALSPRKKLLQNGMYSKSAFSFKRHSKVKIFLDMSFFTNYLSPAKRRSLKYVTDEEIDVVLDGSGFAFGDQWGALYAGKVLADYIEKWKQQGKIIILLPQAFGPFEKPDLKEKMSTILNYSDLIFARDPISLEYLQKLDPANKKINLAPDFTNLLKAEAPAYFDPSTHQVAIIPNNKMITSTKSEAGTAYINLLKLAAMYIIEKGYKPFFLIHEGVGDLALAERVNKQLDKKLPIIVDDSSIAIKGIIGASYAVLTARFHGLVSALSQSVPCLATGWSHKYEMLLADYGYPQGLIDVNIDADNLRKSIDSILDTGPREKLIANLKIASIGQKEKSYKTWEKIFDKITEIKS